MGGHGGLNILPQKKWNVYNYENREKVRHDEEAAAKEEQLKREQSRKRDAEFRLERLRQARGLHHHAPCPHSPNQRSTDSNHINLFEGLEIFPVSELKDGAREDGPKRQKREKKDAAAAPKVVLPEDEKYRLGYGVAGKGVKVPWYLSKPSASNTDEDGNVESAATSTGFKQVESSRKPSGKKTLEELREERMKREKKEKEREQALLFGKNNRDRTSAWRR